MRRPGHTRLRLVIAVLNNCWRGRDDDEMIAAGALDLPAAQLAVALEVLVTMRAGEFEFAHKVRWLWEKALPHQYSKTVQLPIKNAADSKSAIGYQRKFSLQIDYCG